MADGQPDLNTAAERLEKALAALEGRMRTLKSKGSNTTGNLFDQPSAADSAELESLRSQKAALLAAGREASAALGRAADEMRAVLNGEG